MGKPKKPGRPYQQKEDSERYDPTTDIVYNFINEKGYKDKFVKYWKLRKSLLSHLKNLREVIVTQTDGIEMPYHMGKFQIMGFESSNTPIDWPTSLKYNKEHNPPEFKYFYYDNIHTNGIIYKLYYRNYKNTTKGVNFANFKNKDLWSFKSGLYMGKRIKKQIDSKDYYYHMCTRAYLSNRAEYNKYRKLTVNENDW